MGNLPERAMVVLTAGLKCPPEILPPSNIAKVNAAPIATGFPTAKITKIKKKIVIH